MTQEDKELLFTDLCGRLPYGVIMTNIELPQTHYPLTCGDLHDAMFDDDWDDVPYLRPLSSMTEEEYKELKSISSYYGFAPYEFIYDWSPNYYVIDWLNAHHFDYRGLIEKGLAIEVTEENNPYKD